MAQAIFSTRMDEDLKREWEILCKEIGMSVSTAINIFARTMVRERKIPFEVKSTALQLPENQKIVLDKKDFENFIKACFADTSDLKISKKHLELAKEIAKIEEIK